MSDAFPEKLFVAVRDLQSWLSHERIDYAMVGGVAVSLVAQPRFTNDIDAVVWVDPSDGVRCSKALHGTGSFHASPTLLSSQREAGFFC